MGDVVIARSGKKQDEYYRVGYKGWTPFVSSAMRFARKEDAKWLATQAWGEDGDWRLVELVGSKLVGVEGA